MTGRSKLDQRVSRLSEKSFSSPDAKIPITISEPIPRHNGSSDWGGSQRLPPRPDRPAQPWGENVSSELASLKKRLSTVTLVKAFSMRRSQYSTYSQPFPSTHRSFILPTIRTLAAPKKVLVRNRTRRAPPVGARDGRLPGEDKDGYLPLSQRVPFRKPHPFPLSVRGPPDPDGDAAVVTRPLS
jgi:hypothetical protein